MLWMTERTRLQNAYRKAAAYETSFDARFNKLVNEQVRNLIARKFEIEIIDKFIEDTEKSRFRVFVMDEETKKMYTALKDQKALKSIGKQDKEKLDTFSGVFPNTQDDVVNKATTNENSNIIKCNIAQQSPHEEESKKDVEMKQFNHRRSLKLKPIYARIAIVLSIILILAFVREVTAERCPGCGVKWSSSVSEYCLDCKAKQAQRESYTSKYSGGGYSYSITCRYSNCGYACVDGGNYCSRHTCTADGCVNVATGNTMFKYCSAHEESLTCAEKGCCRNKQRDSIYCNIHNAHR